MLILCWLAFSSFAVFAYHDFRRIGVDDGLPNATIYSVAQDQNGYIWLTSTNSGLLRYDGYGFTEFPLLTPQELQQAGHQDVGVLLIDKQNNIWAGTWGYGLSRIDAETGALSRIVMNGDGSTGLAGMHIQALMQDAQGVIWIGTTTGLSKINLDGSIERIGAPNDKQPLAHQRVWSMTQTTDGVIWIGTAQGLHSYQPRNGLSAVIQPNPAAVLGSRDNEIRALTAQENVLWLGCRNGLFRVEQGALSQVPFFDGETVPIINVLRFDQSGSLLLGTYNGLFRVDPKQAQFARFRKEKSLLSTVNIRSIFLDRTGVLWLGSRESGLYYARHTRSAFSSLPDLLPKQQPGQFNFTVTSVFARDNQIWLGSADYLYLVDKQHELIQRYATGGRVNAIRSDANGDIFAATDVGLFLFDTKSKSLQAVKTPFTLAKSTDGNIRDLLIDESGKFWFGLWGEGVLVWDPATNQIASYLKQELQQKVGDAVQAMMLQDDKLWVGTRYSGLFQLDTTTGVVTTPQHLQLPSRDIQCVERGPANSLLICTAKGVLRYSAGNSQHWHSANGLPTDNIVGAYTDARQNIWLLSAQGLTLRPAESERFVTFTRQDGLVATELVFKSIFDDNGTLMIGSISGVALVEPRLLWVNDLAPKVAITHILVNNKNLPMQAHTAKWPVVKLTPTDSSVEFEFASLDYHDVSRNQFKVRLTGFDKEWILHSGKHSAYYSNLPAGEYQFEVKGSNNHGLFSEEVATVTLIVEPPWWQNRPVQAALLLLILALILGVHQYRLRHIQQINKLLQNSVHERSKAQLILETKVTERTRALEESSLTLSLRTKQLEKSLLEIANTNKELTRLDKLKDEFISTVSHELRTPLTSIRGAVGLIAQKVVQPESEPYQLLVQTALNNCERLSNLINDLLDVQKFDAGKFVLQLKNIDLQEAVQQAVAAMRTYADKYGVVLTTGVVEQPVGAEIAQAKDVAEISFSTAENAPADAILTDGIAGLRVMADPLRLRQVLDNLLSNAVKFSHVGGEVHVRILSEPAYLRVEVIDHGIGIPKAFQPRVFEKFSQADSSDARAKEGTGLGLTICKRIIESHQGQIGFYSAEQQGSTFWFRLPRAHQILK